MTRTPKLASLAKAYDQLIFNVEADAEKAHNAIASTDARRPDVMAKVHDGIKVVTAGLEDINSAFDALTNGPPTSPDSAGLQQGSGVERPAVWSAESGRTK